MYKDKEKQKEAGRERQRRYKAKQKALLNQGVTGKALPSVTLIPRSLANVANEVATALPKRGKDIKCFEDLHPSIQAIINGTSKDIDGNIDQHEHSRRTAIAINYQHLFPNRYAPLTAICTGVVNSKPGDADYDGVCTPEWIAEHCGAGKV